MSLKNSGNYCGQLLNRVIKLNIEEKFVKV